MQGTYSELYLACNNTYQTTNNICTNEAHEAHSDNQLPCATCDEIALAIQVIIYDHKAMQKSMAQLNSLLKKSFVIPRTSN